MNERQYPIHLRRIGEPEIADYLESMVIEIDTHEKMFLELCQLRRERDALLASVPKWIDVSDDLPGDPLDGSGEVVELLIEKDAYTREVLPGYYDHYERDWVIYCGELEGVRRKVYFPWWNVIKWRRMPESPEVTVDATD
ncbi:MAG: hypothetical protein IIW43_03855 [Selenomonadales bacterium]|nr:hypothetical protein [Selenomonadales bacterium]